MVRTIDVFETVIEVSLRSPTQRRSMRGVRLLHAEVIEQSLVEHWLRLGLVELLSRNMLANPHSPNAAY